ncbi:hypothetical protein IWQ60_011463 [Tieghemiomyces parasiticus]|uniref:Uncharacterized protein n=1 Tax=Tieghemiomyces parasiticus TaxID=78921 RepID=A0A9W7ZH44_9FUNG|nr:hypothetical protein IWQ60_011463 [Tieghemiomyces parasiticus]
MRDETGIPPAIGSLACRIQDKVDRPLLVRVSSAALQNPDIGIALTPFEAINSDDCRTIPNLQLTTDGLVGPDYQLTLTPQKTPAAIHRQIATCIAQTDESSSLVDFDDHLTRGTGDWLENTAYWQMVEVRGSN